MENITKAQLESMLVTVSQGLDAAKKEEKRAFGFYANLYPVGFSEIDATKAIAYASLHPLMVDVVEKIIELISSGAENSIWIDEENQAGSYLSRSLALHNKKYCKLFADCLLCQDLDHEVHQYEDAQEVIAQWGLCDETSCIVQAIEANPGQHGNELLEELEEIYGDELGNYLGSCNLELEEDDPEEGIDEEIDWGEGYSVRVENPPAYTVLFLDWDKDSATMLVRYNAGEVKVLQYKTPQELQQAVEALEKSCAQQNLLWTMRTGHAIGDLKGWGEQVPPCDLLSLL